MSYKKEQFIEDFKNAYNQTQQLHYLYKYLKEYDGQIASVNVKKLEEETDNVAYYQFIFTLDNKNVIETDSIAFASYTFVDELDNRVTSINNTITSLDRRISNNEGDIVNINDKMLTLPDTAPSTRKVVTIDTNGAQDNINSTELPTLMDNIVDNHGNKRFVEFNGVADASLPAGVTITYNKASLSGTHFMVVIAGTIAEGTVISNNQIFSEFIIPKYISDKIVAVWDNRYIENKTINLVSDTWSTQSISMVLLKLFNTNTLRVYTPSTLTLTDDKHFRVQFDLLIDAD